VEQPTEIEKALALYVGAFARRAELSGRKKG
jgi:hypothetical protein